MSNPERVVRHQLKRSAKDISNEWKRLPEPVRHGITAVGVIGGGALIGGALAGGGAAGGATGAIGGTGIGVGTGTAAATGTAAGTGGFLGTIGSGASAIGSAVTSGVGSGLSALNAANPALLTIGGQALSSAFTPEPERQTDILREQERIRLNRQGPGGGFFGSGGAGPQPSGAFTTPQPSAPPISPVGYFDPQQNQWVSG